jgi:hypothetical protein
VDPVPAREEAIDEVRANEAGAAGDNAFHATPE